MNERWISAPCEHFYDVFWKIYKLFQDGDLEEPLEETEREVCTDCVHRFYRLSGGSCGEKGFEYRDERREGLEGA